MWWELFLDDLSIRLRGRVSRQRLEALEVADRLRRLGGDGEDGTRVSLQERQPIALRGR